jgi:hypothetical protein
MNQAQTDKWLQALGTPEGVRFESPAECGPAWVRLRPLTWREALLREALTCTEEFELDGAGVVRRVLRRYDAVAGRRFDLCRCLLAGDLPGREAAEAVTEELVERLLDGLPPALAAWLEACLEEINLRRPADRARLETVKKS